MHHARLLRHLLNPLIHFIYPPVCLTCRTMLDSGEDRICAACWKSFTMLDPSGPRMEQVRMRVRHEGGVADCVSCYSFEKEGRFQEVIHLLKYGGMSTLGVRLGREIGEKILSDPVFAAADCLVPVPLHPLKRRERGYNQCDYLCRGISQITGMPVRNALLARKKYTVSQTQLSMDERRANVAGAFAVQPRLRETARGRTIIIVDDVITTGATISACAQTLRASDAECVLAASAGLAA